MSKNEQNKSMNTKQINENLIFAKKTNLFPIYLWGLEWWYANKNNKLSLNID
jgi:hypothetical protein